MKKDEKGCAHCEEIEDGVRLSHHDDKTVKDLINRMNRIEGQVRGIKGMMERHVYCDEVLNQIASVQAALNGVGKLLLEKHMKSCVHERLAAGDDAVVDELIKTIYRMMK